MVEVSVVLSGPQDLCTCFSAQNATPSPAWTGRISCPTALNSGEWPDPPNQAEVPLALGGPLHGTHSADPSLLFLSLVHAPHSVNRLGGRRVKTGTRGGGGNQGPVPSVLCSAPLRPPPALALSQGGVGDCEPGGWTLGGHRSAPPHLPSGRGVPGGSTLSAPASILHVLLGAQEEGRHC